jgi:hypothetical protein
LSKKTRQSSLRCEPSPYRAMLQSIESKVTPMHLLKYEP